MIDVLALPAFAGMQRLRSVHRGDRVAQSGFACQRCRQHIQTTTRQKLLPGAGRAMADGLPKEKKTSRITQHKIGVDGSESSASMRPALGETGVSRWGGSTAALWP